MEEVLRRAGFRLTPHRLAIVNYLASTEDHPSARMIYEAVRLSQPGLSRATVYNTLGILVRLGQIKVLEFDLENRHEMNMGLHINLICTVCGNIQDLEESLPSSPEALLSEHGFLVLDHRLEYYGVCEECRASGHPSPHNPLPQRKIRPEGK